MKTILALLLAAVSCAAQSIILQPGESGTLFAEEPDDRSDYFGSTGWFGARAVSWMGPGAHSFISYQDGVRIEAMDDFLTPIAGGWLWQESGEDNPAWPIDMWLRVVTTDDHDVAIARSSRFGFASSPDSQLYIPEPSPWPLVLSLVALGTGFMRTLAERRAMKRF